jgi:hypothetical protein
LCPQTSDRDVALGWLDPVRGAALPVHVHGQVRRPRDLEPLTTHMSGGVTPRTGPDLLFPRSRQRRPSPHRTSTHIALHGRILTRLRA